MTTREQIIAAARIADPSINEETVDFLDEDGMEKLERFYSIAFEACRVAEREACAKVCESTYPEYGGDNPFCFETPVECAEAIRARGDMK